MPTTWAGDWTQAQALFSDYQGAAVIRAPDGSTIYLSGISKALLTAASFEFVAV